MPRQAGRSQSWIPALLFLLLAGCGGQPTAEANPGLDVAQHLLPQRIELPGWTAAGDGEVFGHEDLYNLVNGQADAFFAYGFEEVGVQGYQNAEGTDLSLRIWKLASPADAYGLYSSSASGEPVAVGNDGSTDAGRHLAFWQDRYYVELHAIPELPEADDLQALALTVSARLPAGGERPALLDRLPPEGLEPRGAIYFHEEISIQNDLWLGGENLLGLSPETGGLLAQYDLDGMEAQLLLVQYPNGDAASAGLDALEQGSFERLAAADVQQDLLGAVFSALDPASAQALLDRALRRR